MEIVFFIFFPNPGNTACSYYNYMKKISLALFYTKIMYSVYLQLLPRCCLDLDVEQPYYNYRL